MENVTGELVKELQKQNKKMLIQITSVWCGPCKQLTPILERLEKEFSDIQFFKVDVNQNGDYIEELEIKSVPTVIFYSGNDVIDRSTGLKPELFYRDLLQKNI